MSDETQLKCLLLPLQGTHRLVVPNTLVAEVLLDLQVEKSTDISPKWMSGTISWQGRDIPLISYETLCNMDTPDPASLQQGRCVVLHALQYRDNTPFFAVTIAGVPSFEFLDNSNLSESFEQRVESAFVAKNIYINGLFGIIPDIDAISELLVSRGV